MNLLALLHRWAGGIAGLLLAAMALSGTVLLWEGSWIGLPGADEPYRSTTADLARAVEVAGADGRELARITFASEEIGLHLATYRDGGGAYIDQSGRVVDIWDSLWGRPELWLFDLHHYLLLGHWGEYVTGGLGLLLIAFAVTGAILWWRTRKTFKFRLWPARMTRSAIVRQHRDIGVVASPLLVLSALTGSLMVFAPLSDALLAPWSQPGGAEPEIPTVSAVPQADADWRAVMAAGQAAFPGAAPRRLQFPSEPGQPMLLRLRQDFEWTPNGRTYAYLDPAGARVVAVDDPAADDTARAVQEKFYPVHAAKVGGPLWKLALSFGGLALAVLGLLASWSFWFGSSARPQAAMPRATATRLS